MFAVIVSIFAALIITFGSSLVVLRLARKTTQSQVIRERDVHKIPVPRLGGVAIYFGVIAAMIVGPLIGSLGKVPHLNGLTLPVVVAGAFIVLVGMADDLWDLDWTIKLAAQLLVAAFLTWSGLQILSLPFEGLVVGTPAVSFVMTMLVIVVTMNAINFLDGLDGLLAGISVISNTAFAIYVAVLIANVGSVDFLNLAFSLCLGLVGASAGFLILNWHPAKLFMGDSGSMLIGMYMAVSAVAVTGQIDPKNVSNYDVLPALLPILLPVLLLLVPLTDFVLTVVRRLMAGLSPFAPDRKHLHHRLLDVGHTHLQAVLVLYAWATQLSFGTILILMVQPMWVPILIDLIGLVLCVAFTLKPLMTKQKVS